MDSKKQTKKLEIGGEELLNKANSFKYKEVPNTDSY